MIFNKENFQELVENSNDLVLVDFFAEWCGPCQMMAPIIDEIIKENKNKNIKIGKINIDENNEIAAKFNVMSIPTFILFKNGKVINRIQGYCDKESLLEMINNK